MTTEAEALLKDDDVSIASWAEQSISYLERSLIITLGLTTITIAGFLSQIWNGAVPELRSDIANNLYSFGTLFNVSLMLPLLRFGAELSARTNMRRYRLIYTIWVLSSVTLFGAYTRVLTETGNIILKHAAVPQTKQS